MTTRLIAKSALGLFVLALVAAGSIVSAAPAEARVFVGFGFGPFWGFPYPYYPYPYYSAPYYAPPVVYSPGYAPPDPGYAPGDPGYAAGPAAAPATWYYCSNPSGYYPYVQQCNTGWRQVPATPPQQ